MTVRAMSRLVLVLGLALAGAQAHALTEGRMSLTDLVARSNQIVVGTVFDMTSVERFFGDHARIVTDVSLSELKVVKGEVAATELVVTQFGGKVGDVMEWYPGLPSFEAERRYLVFLLRANLDLAIPIGRQGLFLVETDPERGLEVLTSSNGLPVLEVREDFVRLGALVRGGPGAAENLADAMTLEDFLSEIQARLE